MATASLLSYTGSKKHLACQIFSYYPSSVRHYVEPFVGGGSMLLYTLQQNKNNPDTQFYISGKVYAFDVNKRLINFHKAVQSHPKELHKNIKALLQKYERCTSTESRRLFFNAVRSTMNSDKVAVGDSALALSVLNTDSAKKVHQAAMLWFLNKTCYGSMYRENRKGNFNVAFNKTRGHVRCPSLAHICAVSDLIRPVVFQCCDYKDALVTLLPILNSSDLLFMDPPYANSKLMYVGGILFDQKYFSGTMLPLIQKSGSKAIITNSDTSDYSSEGYKQTYIHTKVTLSKKVDSVVVRAKRRESLFINYTTR